MKIISSTVIISSILLSISISFSSYASPVNINTANASTIADSLSGIGQHKATAIINYRQKHGLFKQAIDIVKVRGIGRATYTKNKMDILTK